MQLGRWATLTFLVLVPVGTPLFDLSASDLARIAQVIVATVCAAELLRSRFMHECGGQPATSLTWAAMALTLLAIASLAFAPDLQAAARELALFLGLASITAVIAFNGRNTHFDAFATAVTAAALLNAGLVLVVMVAVTWHSGRLDPAYVVVGYDNHRFFNHVQTVLLPLLTIATSGTLRHGEFSRLAWIALILNFALLFFTQGRATGVALLGASLLSLMLFGRAAVVVLRHLAIAAVIGAFVHRILFIVVPALLGTSLEVPRAVGDLQSFDERIQLWRLAIDYTAQHPWLGIGPMHYAHYVNPIAAHPHNIYLQIASEWGVPMLIGLLAVSLCAASRMAQTIRACKEPSPSTMGIALFVSVVAAAIDGLFSGNFVMPVSQVWIAFAVGWAIAWTRSNSPAAVETQHPTRLWHMQHGAAALLAASQVWLCWSIASEVTDLDAHLVKTSHALESRGNIRARFWSYGWF